MDGAAVSVTAFCDGGGFPIGNPFAPNIPPSLESAAFCDTVCCRSCGLPKENDPVVAPNNPLVKGSDALSVAACCSCCDLSKEPDPAAPNSPPILGSAATSVNAGCGRCGLPKENDPLVAPKNPPALGRAVVSDSVRRGWPNRERVGTAGPPKSDPESPTGDGLSAVGRGIAPKFW